MQEDERSQAGVRLAPSGMTACRRCWRRVPVARGIGDGNEDSRISADHGPMKRGQAQRPAQGESERYGDAYARRY